MLMGEQIVSYIGTLGFGGLLGIFLKSILDDKINQKKQLFEARSKAYSEISGRIFNLFLEPDITILRNDDLIWAKINTIISGAMLLASPELCGLLGQYKVEVHEFHKSLSKKDDKESARIHKNLIQLAGKIFDNMRKDLYITSKTAWEKKREI